MKIKFLAILSLALFLGSVGCRSASNTANTAVLNTNTNVAVATPAATMAPAMDTATQTTVKSALDKAGLKDISVEATTSTVTLRGTVPKGKMAEAVRVAQEAGKKPVKSELLEK